MLAIEEIRERLLDGERDPNDRLVISPVLDWDLQAAPGTAALDVRLGQRFRVPRRAKLDHLDHLSEDHTADIERYNDDHYVFLGDYFALHPRQFVLGETLEWIHLPRDLAGYVIGRSSWGRDGLVIATATGIHPNYSGILTLEITNLGEIPVRLYPGLRIAQLFLHEVTTVSEEDSEEEAEDVSAKESDDEPTGIVRSKYAGSTHPRSGNAAEGDEAILKKIRDRGRGL